MAFPADIGTGTQVFSEPFTYSDGAVSSVSGGVWGNPFWTGQAASAVVSDELRVGPVTSGFTDCYTADDTFADGDYIFTLVGKPSDTNQLLAHIMAAREAESGVDSYAINLAPASGTDRIRLQRWNNGSVAATLIDVNVETAAGDQFCIRRDGTDIMLARKPSAGSWTQVGTTQSDANLTAGRIAFESNSGNCIIDDVGYFELPTDVQNLDLGTAGSADAPEGLDLAPSGSATLDIGSTGAVVTPSGYDLDASGSATLDIGSTPAIDAPAWLDLTGQGGIALGEVPAPSAPPGLALSPPPSAALAAESDTSVVVEAEIPPVEAAASFSTSTTVSIAGAAIIVPHVPYGRELSHSFGAPTGGDARETVQSFLP